MIQWQYVSKEKSFISKYQLWLNSCGKERNTTTNNTTAIFAKVITMTSTSWMSNCCSCSCRYHKQAYLMFLSRTSGYVTHPPSGRNKRQHYVIFIGKRCEHPELTSLKIHLIYLISLYFPFYFIMTRSSIWSNWNQ